LHIYDTSSIFVAEPDRRRRFYTIQVTKSATRRRRSSGQSKAVEGISQGSDLTLLMKPSKEEGNIQGIMYALHSIFVPKIVARCGMRWWDAHCNAQVTNVLREIVVKHNLGHFGPSYDMLREATSASDLAVLLRTKLCASNPWPTTTRNQRMAAPSPKRTRTRRGKVVTPLLVAMVLSFNLISKVFRPEFEARRIERRT
jgi:hypothetical protein